MSASASRLRVAAADARPVAVGTAVGLACPSTASWTSRSRDWPRRRARMRGQGWRGAGSWTCAALSPRSGRSGRGPPTVAGHSASARWYRRGDEQRPVPAPRHGRDPVRGRHDVPRLGAPRGGGLRHGHVRRLGRRPDARSLGTATARRGTWSADVAGVAPGAEYRFTIRTPDGDLSRMDPYARARHELGRQRHRLRPGRLRLGRRRVRDAGLGRPRHLRDAHRHVRRDRTTGAARSTAPAAAAATSSELGVSAVQVMPPFEFAGDISWGYNPAHLFAIESVYGGPDAFKRVHPRRPRATASPSSSTSSTTTSARRTSTCGGSTAGPRARAAGSTSTTTSARSRRGARPAPTTAAARSARSCATAR